MAPVVFIYLMNAFTKTLSEKWTFKKLDFKWFPESKNGNKPGRLMGDRVQNRWAQNSIFSIFCTSTMAPC